MDINTKEGTRPFTFYNFGHRRQQYLCVWHVVALFLNQVVYDNLLQSFKKYVCTELSVASTVLKQVYGVTYIMFYLFFI